MKDTSKRNNKSYKLHVAAAGDRPNENVVKCRICKSNGFAHEAIDFRKISSGRIKNDGSYEFQNYEIIDYFTGARHEHRRPRRVSIN